MTKVKEKKVKEKRDKLNAASAMIMLFLIIYAAALLLMYLWGFFTSLKSTIEFRKNLYGLPKGWPWDWAWENYEWAFNNMTVPVYKDNSRIDVGLFGMLSNSLIYALLGPLVSLSITWLVAYLIASFPKLLSRIIFRLNIVLMMIPIIGSLPSALQLYMSLGLYDTWGYVVVSGISFIGSNLLIFHAYFSSVSKEIKEAASIDGAGNMSIMLKIVFPLTSKMFGILFLIAFIGRWNDYMTMLIWMPSKPTLAYGIYMLSTSTETAGTWPPRQFAGCMILMLPILIVFLIFKDKIIGQVTMGALKG